jgi:hypothetical protein
MIVTISDDCPDFAGETVDDWPLPGMIVTIVEVCAGADVCVRDVDGADTVSCLRRVSSDVFAETMAWEGAEIVSGDEGAPAWSSLSRRFSACVAVVVR